MVARSENNCALVFQGLTYQFQEEYAASRYVRRNLSWFQRFTSVNLERVCEGTQKYNPLFKTRYEQPAILAVELLKAREDDGHRHDAFMGHSFGELAALRAAQVIKSDEEAMFLAQTRGECMAKANYKNPGSMVALVGNIPMSFAAYVCEKNGVSIGTVNVPGEQIVISGRTSQVEAVCKIFTRQEIRIFPLDTGGAFHSPEMEEAKINWQDSVMQIKFHPPNEPVIMMSTGQVETDPALIKECLLKQLTQSVHLEKAVNTLVADLGVEEIHEVGSRKTITVFITKIKRRLLRKNRSV